MTHDATRCHIAKQIKATYWNILKHIDCFSTADNLHVDCLVRFTMALKRPATPNCISKGEAESFSRLGTPMTVQSFQLRMLWRKKIGIRTRRTETEGKTKIGKEKNNKKQHHVSASSRNADMLTTQHIKLPLSDTRPQTHAVAHLPVNQHWTVLKGFQNKKRLQPRTHCLTACHARFLKSTWRKNHNISEELGAWGAHVYFSRCPPQPHATTPPAMNKAARYSKVHPTTGDEEVRNS